MTTKEGGLRGGIRNVGVGVEVDAIPDSVTNRWPMDEGSGTTLNADVGSIDGELFGATWLSDSSGVGGFVTDYDGTDDYWAASTNPNINDTQYTTMGWFKFNSISDSSDFMVGLEGDPPDTKGWRYSVDTDGSSLRLAHLDGDFNVVTTFGTITTNTWYFIAAAGDGDNANVYLYDNDQLLASDTGSAARTVTGTSRLQGGGSNENGQFQEIEHDAPAISTNTQMSQSEIEEYWQLTQR